MKKLALLVFAGFVGNVSTAQADSEVFVCHAKKDISEFIFIDTNGHCRAKLNDSELNCVETDDGKGNIIYSLFSQEKQVGCTYYPSESKLNCAAGYRCQLIF